MLRFLAVGDDGDKLNCGEREVGSDLHAVQFELRSEFESEKIEKGHMHCHVGGYFEKKKLYSSMILYERYGRYLQYLLAKTLNFHPSRFSRAGRFKSA